MFDYTRFLVHMVQRTLKDLLPFIIFLIGQLFFLASVFTHLSVNDGEDFLGHDDEYKDSSIVFKAFYKTVDFTVAKDGYRFKKPIGILAYVLGILYLNIVILNLVIALVGEVYDGVMQVRNETGLKLKAEMLKELYDVKSSLKCLFT